MQFDSEDEKLLLNLQKGWIRFKLGRAAKRHGGDARFPDEVPVEAAPPPRRRKK